MNEFMEVFRNNLCGTSPKRKIDFGNDILPYTQPISIPSYRLATVKL